MFCVRQQHRNIFSACLWRLLQVPSNEEKTPLNGRFCLFCKQSPETFNPVLTAMCFKFMMKIRCIHWHTTSTFIYSMSKHPKWKLSFEKRLQECRIWDPPVENAGDFKWQCGVVLPKPAGQQGGLTFDFDTESAGSLEKKHENQTPCTRKSNGTTATDSFSTPVTRSKQEQLQRHAVSHKPWPLAITSWISLCNSAWDQTNRFLCSLLTQVTYIYISLTYGNMKLR